MISISVIVPVFNAQHSLAELTQRLTTFLSTEGRTYEIILVDDGSKDQSWHLIRNLAEQYKGKVKGIRLSRNFGQHNATITGFNKAIGEYIVTIDDDLQFDPASISLLLEKEKETRADVVYGIPVGVQGRQKTSSRIWKYLSRSVNNSTGEGSSFRLIKRELAIRIRSHFQPFVFIDEVLSWYTRSIEFVKVPHHKRTSGRSGYTKRKLIALTGNLIIFYSSVPLKMMTYSGMFLSMVTFLLGAFFFAKKVFFKVAVPGFTALIVTILFTTSIILLCFGILGEYIRRMYLVMNGVPNHHIAEVAE